MEMAAIINEIDNLPTYKRMLILEQIIHSIRFKNQEIDLEKAANCLYNDYKNDKKLTEFVQLDYENFYETR